MTDDEDIRKILLLAEAGDIARIESALHGFGALGWQRAVEVRSLDNKNLSHKEKRERKESNNEKLLTEFDENAFNRIFAIKGMPFDPNTLQNQGLACREFSCVKTIIEATRDELKSRSLDWLSYAVKEWIKSDIRGIHPQAWVEQFSDLGYKTVGQHLLKSLQVIPRAEFRDAFVLPRDKDVGFQVMHGYIKDDEPGSSSGAIKDALDKMYSHDKVLGIDLTTMTGIVETDADLIYIYEDGLWSGVELMQRLTKIWEIPQFRDSNLQLHFKYAATADAGLATARLFSKRKCAGRFQFHVAKQHFSFFKQGTDLHFKALSNCSDEQIRPEIDAAVEPFAFRIKELWGKNRETAIEVCANIGKQLVIPYLNRKNTKITPEKIKQWQLGASGFASTIVFASSIPKPVLPVFWLGGQVTLDGKTVEWRPLFNDVRRTG